MPQSHVPKTRFAKALSNWASSAPILRQLRTDPKANRGPVPIPSTHLCIVVPSIDDVTLVMSAVNLGLLPASRREYTMERKRSDATVERFDAVATVAFTADYRIEVVEAMESGPFAVDADRGVVHHVGWISDNFEADAHAVLGPAGPEWSLSRGGMPVALFSTPDESTGIRVEVVNGRAARARAHGHG